MLYIYGNETVCVFSWFMMKNQSSLYNEIFLKWGFGNEQNEHFIIVIEPTLNM